MDQGSLFINERKGKVMTLMVPIRNDPDCSNGACHYHPPEKILLGILDVGVSQENLDRSLGLLRLRMIVFCVMILILTLGGVTALLWRNVMLPLTSLADFAENRAQGRLDEKPPRGTGDIKRLADAIQKMIPGGTETEAKKEK
jgi:HAMP domain-containing protein